MEYNHSAIKPSAKNSTSIFNVTVHMIVKNEDVFVGYALASVLPFVSKAIIYDTGSVDRTAQIIKDQLSVIKKENKTLEVIFETHVIEDPRQIGLLRLEQLKRTKTEWILLLDGDEIWQKDQLFKLLQVTKELSKETLAVVNKTRNCVGDIRHYLPEYMGRYSFFGRTGNYNIRLMRCMDYKIRGVYPNEAYVLNDEPINNQQSHLSYSDAWYLHTTHLLRSSKTTSVFGRRKTVFSKGLDMQEQEIPEVMRQTNWPKRGVLYEIRASIYDIIRTMKHRNTSYSDIQKG